LVENSNNLSAVDSGLLRLMAADVPDYGDELDNTPGTWRSVIDTSEGDRKWTPMRWGFVT
jgi:hypothetical protein